MSKDKNIKHMAVDEIGYVVSWAFYELPDGSIFLRGDYPYSNVPEGTFNVMVERQPRGVKIVNDNVEKKPYLLVDSIEGSLPVCNAPYISFGDGRARNKYKEVSLAKVLGAYCIAIMLSGALGFYIGTFWSMSLIPMTTIVLGGHFTAESLYQKEHIGKLKLKLECLAISCVWFAICAFKILYLGQ